MSAAEAHANSARQEFRQQQAGEAQGDGKCRQPGSSRIAAWSLQSGIERERQRAAESLAALEALRAVTPPGEGTDLGRAIHELEFAAHRERIAVLDRMLATADRSAIPAR